MSNFLLRQPDCVLIHIPKTGGTSIRKGVWAKRYEGPVFGAIPDEWAGYFRFAFVRHPLQRMISAWRMFTEGALGDADWRMPADARPLDIESFVDIVTDEGILFDQRRRTFAEKIRHHTIPQTHPFNCLELAQFIGRYERLEEDFAYISQRLGLRAALPRIHTTTPTPWQRVLHGRLLDRCIEYYREDFARLGYAIP